MVLVAGGALLFANHAWPVANLKFRVLYSVTRKKPTLNLEDEVFYGIEGHAIRAAKVDKETGRLEDVLIHQHGGGRDGAGLVIRAEEGTMKLRTGQFTSTSSGDPVARSASNPVCASGTASFPTCSPDSTGSA